MDLFFEVQRDKTHVYIDAKETDTVVVLKQMIEGVLKIAPASQRLYWREAGNVDDTINAEWNELDDAKALNECGFMPNNARAQAPLLIALACENEGIWEEPLLSPLSIPPPLPDVMRPGNEGETAQATA